MKVTKVQPVVATPKVVSRLPRKNPYVLNPANYLINEENDHDLSI